MSKREVILQDLLSQLQANGTATEYFINLVEDYMVFWDIKNQLQEDVKLRGVVYLHTTDRGAQNMKKNDSVTELVKVNDRMVKLLDSLGLCNNVVGGDADEL